MKALKILTGMVLFASLSCNKEQIDDNLVNDKFQQIDNPQSQNKGSGTFGYPSNQMVVQYDPTITSVQKQNMRDFYGVSNYKTCPCADPSLELWIFELDINGGLLNGATIEEVVLGAKDNSGLEGTDLNPFFQHTAQKLNYSFGIADLNVGLQHRVQNNEALTIAVLDTGVDYNYFKFNTPFLYNTSNGCYNNSFQDYYGWDFVNDDNDPYDDYGHGTIITSIVYEKLKQNNVNFQVLPIKVFDENGNGNYFDILCGFKYAINNEDVDMLNLSFGWYNTNYSLLERFILESESKVLISASAGNNGQDNDITVHYPSSYPTSNLLSVAALTNNPLSIELASFSNYGITSVDIAALGENIPFYITPNDQIFVSGTSYANAYTTAFGGRLFSQAFSPQQHFSEIIGYTLFNPNLSRVKYRSYIYY